MTTAQLDAFAARFEASAIPSGEWTHEAHLIIGAWHVHRFGVEAALVRLRTAIRRLNEANGVANTPTGGYHETITAAYLRLLANALAADTTLPFEARVTAVLASPLADRAALSRHYSPELLMSQRARVQWVAPDREPLPDPPPGFGAPPRLR